MMYFKSLVFIRYKARPHLSVRRILQTFNCLKVCQQGPALPHPLPGEGKVRCRSVRSFSGPLKDEGLFPPACSDNVTFESLEKI